MKNKGFTLIELLAVIAILAIIALIAVPQILNLIEQSKMNSLEISASEYVRAVEISLMNEQINTNVPDGFYIIVDDGKAIELNGEKIQVETSGNRIQSGGLLVENKKVVRIIKGKIKDYYVRIENKDMKLYKEIKESTLLTGEEFNQRIKQLAGDGNEKLETSDMNIKEIIFLPESILPEGISKEELTTFKSVSVSNDNSIIAYYDGQGTVYIYSDNIIQTNTYTTSMFFKLQGLTNITFNLLDTSKTTQMAHMFDLCSSLTEVDVSNFDTSQVTNLNYIFSGCESMKRLDLSNWNVAKTSSMASMFNGCTNLIELDLNNFDTRNVLSMGGMFSGCSNLTELNLSSFDTSKVRDMGGMFNKCTKLVKLDLSNFDTSEVTSMVSMFHDCTNLTELDLSNFNTSKVIGMGTMFGGCSSLSVLDLRSFDISNVTGMSYMFYWCKNLEEILVSSNTWVINGDANVDYMFLNCKTDEVTRL